MGTDQIKRISTSEFRAHIRARYCALLDEIRQKDSLLFRYVAKGYYIERIADETGYSHDYIAKIINKRC